MNRRQKVLAVIRREYDGYIPYTFSLTPRRQKKFHDEFYEWNYQAVFNLPYQFVHRVYNGDVPNWKDYYEPKEVTHDHYFDEFGVGRLRSDFFNLNYLISPLKHASLQDIERYPFPNPNAYNWSDCTDHRNEIVSHDSVPVGFLAMTLFETGWTLRGYDQWLRDIEKQSLIFYQIMDILTALRVEEAIHLAKVGVDVLHIGDDVADENGLLFDPAIWRTEFKPRMVKIIKAAKQIKPDLLIEYHGEGNLVEIIPDLIEIGVDMLNPIEPESVNPFALKEQFGDRLSFRGGLSIATTLPHGTEEDVREQTLELMKKMAKRGGFLLSPTQSIDINVPWNNFEMFLKTVISYNRTIKNERK
jgi:uroporphyrinogen decarboxylase